MDGRHRAAMTAWVNLITFGQVLRRSLHQHILQPIQRAGGDLFPARFADQPMRMAGDFLIDRLGLDSAAPRGARWPAD